MEGITQMICDNDCDKKTECLGEEPRWEMFEGKRERLEDKVQEEKEYYEGCLLNFEMDPCYPLAVRLIKQTGRLSKTQWSLRLYKLKLFVKAVVVVVKCGS
jgi:hypothetical protein